MPAMAALLEGAAVVDTLAPEGVFVSANWPTLFTATRPDRHRYLCWEEIRGGTYEHRYTTPHDVHGRPFWERLSDADRRVAVFDVPHTVVRPLDGAMVSEWGCHDRHLGTSSWPPELARELTERHGSHLGSVGNERFDQFAPCDYVHRAGEHRTAAESVALFEDILAGVERKREASLELLDRGGWDMFLSVFGESHCVGHQLWHLHEREHPAHDEELARALGGDPMRTVYRRLDSVIAAHLERRGPDTTVYVLLPHGMTAHHDGTHLLDQILYRLDWALDDPDGLGGTTRAAAAAARVLPGPLRRRALRMASPLLRARAGDSGGDVLPPLELRRWFLTPNNTVVGGVRLNVAGREPRGRIHPDDRAAVLGWLSERLLELVNVEGGGPVVRRCVVADDVYRRSPGDALADLYVEWERSAPIERVWSPATGTVSAPYTHWRQGDHVREGLMLALGPGIRAGRRREVHETTDVGATISAAAGLVLDDVDGAPIASVLPAHARRELARERGSELRRRALARAARALRPPRRPEWARREDPSLPLVRSEIDAQSARLARVEERLDRSERVHAMMAWLPQAEVSEELLVSVVMPTRDRPELLRRAVESVRAQSHRNWELLVVDDGGQGDAEKVANAFEDPRIRLLRTQSVGAAAARNAALDAATGDVVAYLDDDNSFDPEWLKAVAVTFGELPDARVLYGARIIDDSGRVRREPTAARPELQFMAWSREGLAQGNLADMNTLAHRAGPLRFDEELSYVADWDLLVRLTETAEPVEVPAIAAYYSTDSPGRISSRPLEELEREVARLQEKLAALGT